MRLARHTPARTAGVAIALLLGLPAGAQRTPAAPVRSAAPATYDPALYSSPAATSSAFKAMRWRNIGPTRGGRANAVVGDPVKPFTFYLGGVNGGVWRTTNAGQTWNNITDGKTDISSVGAMAIAPSDPNVIYVGTGESQLREDLTVGTGIYRSTDAGATWTRLGLPDSHQIADIIVDPRDPDHAWVAVMGHAFGPNAERGVFRTSDGGKSWRKVLFINDSTGANDLSIDPSNPRILYASMYKFQRTPWSMISGGGRSGIWKTVDGGDTWTELTFKAGIPARPLGKIGLDVSPANPQRIYASIEAPDSSGGIFRSDDAGENWQRMNTDARFWVRSWYYSQVTADPQDENTVYVMNLGVYRSIDGGKTFGRVRVPHGDMHTLWIDPKDNRRMINANDGGGTISLDRGETWSSIYNQPTAQFYHVTTDNQFPYRIYGAQQDNSAISIASRSDDGEIGERDYYSVAGCENATVAVDPRNPNITYGGCYMGAFSRYDHGRRQERDISVTMRNYDGWGAADVPERFQWTFPVLISPHDPSTLYVTSQHVWRSRTEGASWERISPDLTVHDPKTLQRTGGPIHGEMTGAEWYATIYAFAESPKLKGVLWAGSDDGLLHLSRNGGATWENVTPPGYGRFTRTAHIDPSPHDPAVVYVAANRYQQDDFAPYLWKSADYGKTWVKIVTGIPGTAYTRVVREDPVRRGLLYAGTEYGVLVSMDDGARWQPLQLNLPRVSVRDLTVHGTDLIAATHGRAFWVIDDVSPLRALTAEVMQKPVHLLQPATAMLWSGWNWRSGEAGENPPPGALVDYWLRETPAAGTAVTVQFLDAKGTLIRTFSADNARDTTRVPNDTVVARRVVTDSLAYHAADSIPRIRAGTNRFFWNLRYPDARELRNTVIDEGSLTGPKVPPGTYTVRLIVGRDTSSRQFAVVADPRVTSTTAELTAQFDAAMRVRSRLNELVDRVERLEDIQSQLDARAAQTKDAPYAKQVAEAARAARQKLELVRGELYETACHVDQCTLDQPVRLYNWFITLNSQLQSGDYPPTQQHGEIFTDLSTKLDLQLRALDRIEGDDIRKFNEMLQGLGIPSVYVKPKPPIS
ncbi:MAG: glycosyl hydrolase [Gemmatimonadaceae bacterium]|nr:glycosyl hydrolase [Gemmatimonadaceae bacterium]